jgi:hypothetical protein
MVMWAQTTRQAVRWIAVVGTMTPTLGCADFETLVDPSGGAPDVLVASPSFAANVAPIFEKRCATGGCHSIATHQAGLTLAPANAYDALVGVSSALRPSVLRVSPSQPDQSWLVTMISADDGARQGFSRMPLATHPLTANQIATIVRWIEQGALRN